MKKKVIVIIAVLIAAILLVPIPHRLKDGGSVEYKAILYTVKSVHQIDHNSEFGYIEGTIIKILGIEVFNNTEEKTNPKNNSKGGAKNNEIALNEPPALTVIYGKENVKALRGTTSWTYVNEDGTSTSVASDSLHPLQAKEYMPSLNLFPSTLSSSEPLKATLKWDFVPDKVTARCWSEDCWEQVGDYNETSEEIPLKRLIIDSDTETDPIISIEMKDGNYIYEITAEWNSYEKCSGKAYYSFYTVCPDYEEACVLPPAPQSAQE